MGGYDGRVKPSRKEKFELQFENKGKDWKPTLEGNFVNVSNDGDRVIIHFNTEKKKHAPIHFELQFGSGKSVIDTYNNRLSELLRRSYKLYKRKYLFIPKNTWGSNRNKVGNEYKQVAPSTPSMWLRKFVSGRVINVNSGLKKKMVEKSSHHTTKLIEIIGILKK